MTVSLDSYKKIGISSIRWIRHLSSKTKRIVGMNKSHTLRNNLVNIRKTRRIFFLPME